VTVWFMVRNMNDKSGISLMEDDAKEWDDAVSMRIYESIELLMDGERRRESNEQGMV
jgi:hypothetical protein